MIFKLALKDKFLINCYVDADFAGLWGYKDPQDPSCVKSRTRYVICIMDYPVVWVSKLQTAITTSTQESKYNAFLMSMRDLLPLQQLAKSIIKGLGGDGIGTANV